MIGIHARLCAFDHCWTSVSSVRNLDNALQYDMAFWMPASLPAATAFRRGHSSTLWSSLVKQAAHALPSPDDPEAGGPGPACGPEADGPEAGGSAAGGPASVGGPAFSPGLCFFGGGLGEDPEDELSDEGEDELR